MNYSEMHIQIENLSFRYKSLGSPPDYVLQDINLQVQQGEILAMVGPSGSGKTSFMQQLTGLLKPDRGRVLVDGEDIHGKGFSLSRLRRRIGLVFQFPETQLFEETVFDDVAFGPRNLGLSEQVIADRAKESMQKVGLEFEKFKQRSPFRLSEGEKRRAAIAGVLALQPECLVLDEPTAGLDPRGAQAVTNILTELHTAGKSVLVISHNLDWIASFVNRIILIHKGQIRFDGNKGNLFQERSILESAGLLLPRVQHLVNLLKQKGWIQSESLYSVPDIQAELAKTLHKETESF